MAQETAKDVLLFVPNIIGYVRIFLAIIALYFVKTDYILSCVCFGVSEILDEIDGPVARAFKQCSNFGEMLDIMTDIFTTTSIISISTVFYPEYYFRLQMNAVLTAACHWMRCHVSALEGSYHKSINRDETTLIKLYYSSRALNSVLHYGNVGFYMLLYVHNFIKGPVVKFGGLNIGLVRLMLYIAAPIMVMKMIVNVIRLVEASKRMASIDAKNRSKHE